MADLGSLRLELSDFGVCEHSARVSVRRRAVLHAGQPPFDSLFGGAGDGIHAPLEWIRIPVGRHLVGRVSFGDQLLGGRQDLGDRRKRHAQNRATSEKFTTVHSPRLKVRDHSVKLLLCLAVHFFPPVEKMLPMSAACPGCRLVPIMELSFAFIHIAYPFRNHLSIFCRLPFGPNRIIQGPKRGRASEIPCRRRKLEYVERGTASALSRWSGD